LTPRTLNPGGIPSRAPRSLVFLILIPCLLTAPAAARVRHLLYAAVPGVQNHYPDNNYNLRYGGIGIIVFDMDNGFQFVKRIPTWTLPPGAMVEIVKGIAADPSRGRLYLTTPKLVAAFDLLTDKIVWQKSYEGGFDRLAISPDGSTLYVPTFEGAYWDVLKASNGDLITRLDTGTGSHNTIWSADGKRVYLAGLHYNYLLVADPSSNKVTEKIGPFSDAIRPFTVNGSNSLCFVNVNKFLGFEIGDIKTGKELYEVPVKGFASGHALRHGCPSHGIALTPDEKELWLADGVNYYLHVFDATVMPPKQIDDIKLSDSPGWITFSIGAKYVFPSTGDVIDRKTRKIVYTLRDETGTQVQSEKLIEIDFNHGKPVRAGNQFGIGQKK
jgi:DNA-binding beta-propeller fold protein YncE